MKKLELILLLTLCNYSAILFAQDNLVEDDFTIERLFVDDNIYAFKEGQSSGNIERKLDYQLKTPSDDVILKTIFNTINKGGETATVLKSDYVNSIEKELNIKSLSDSVTYEVYKKENIYYENEEAINIYIRTRGEKLNFFNNFYLGANNSTYKILYEEGEKGSYFNVDEMITSYVKTVKIGKNKSALINVKSSTSYSDDNPNGPNSITKLIFSSLDTTLGVFDRELLRVEVQNSNAFNYVDQNTGLIDKDKIPENESCPIHNEASSFKIIVSDKVYYDIQVTTTNQNYGLGCTSKNPTKTTTNYMYEEGKYLQKN